MFIEFCSLQYCKKILVKYVVDDFGIVCFFVFFRINFSTIQNFGETREHIMLQEGRLYLTHKRPNWRLTGTHSSPRTVWEWGSLESRILIFSSETRQLTHCTRWSRTDIIVTPHSVVTNGRRWLVRKPPYSKPVVQKFWMPFALSGITPKQELALLATIKLYATRVILE